MTTGAAKEYIKENLKDVKDIQYLNLVLDAGEIDWGGESNQLSLYENSKEYSPHLEHSGMSDVSALFDVSFSLFSTHLLTLEQHI